LPSVWHSLTTILLAAATRNNNRVTEQSDGGTEGNPTTTDDAANIMVPYLALVGALTAPSLNVLQACCVQQLLQHLHSSSAAPTYFSHSSTTSCAAPWGVESQQLLLQLFAEHAEWMKLTLLPHLASNDDNDDHNSSSLSLSGKHILQLLVQDVLDHLSTYPSGTKAGTSKSSSKPGGTAPTGSLSLFCSASCKAKITKAIQPTATAVPRVKSESISAVLCADDNDATPASPKAAPVPPEMLAEVNVLENAIREHVRQVREENKTLETDVAALQVELEQAQAARRQQVMQDVEAFNAAKKSLDEQDLHCRTQVKLVQEELDSIEKEVQIKQAECDALEHQNALQRDTNIKNAGLEGLAKQLQAKEAELFESEQRIAKLLQKPTASGGVGNGDVSKSSGDGDDASPQPSSSYAVSAAGPAVSAAGAMSLDSISDLTKDQFEGLKQKKIANVSIIANLNTTLQTLETEYVPPASYASWHDKKMVDQQSELIAQKKTLLLKIRQREESILDNCDPKREQPRPASFCPLPLPTDSADGADASDRSSLPLVDDTVVATLQPSAVPARRRSSVGAAVLASSHVSSTPGVQSNGGGGPSHHASQLSQQILPPPSREKDAPSASIAGAATVASSSDAKESSVSLPKAGRRRMHSPSASSSATVTTNSSTTTDTASPHSATSSTMTAATDHSPRAEPRRTMSPMPPVEHISTASDASPQAGARSGRRATNATRHDDATAATTAHRPSGGDASVKTSHTGDAAAKQQQAAEEALLATILSSTSSVAAAPIKAKEEEPSWI
jgi:hypothetical protein